MILFIHTSLTNEGVAPTETLTIEKFVVAKKLGVKIPLFAPCSYFSLVRGRPPAQSLSTHYHPFLIERLSNARARIAPLNWFFVEAVLDRVV